ncbi:hypothetical protein BDY19DRAFT_979596 [Irpex rosettiformis]|uniref:Uncharacterized protein n=1 Tax=Irpex rosettiformis TaxID=378272 RepID=A0ACB8TMS5_9APHY|nr:hypothetical protein BDY19DRAFT_979596 [Irpex rosettiformis]
MSQAVSLQRNPQTGRLDQQCLRVRPLLPSPFQKSRADIRADLARIKATTYPTDYE